MDLYQSNPFLWQQSSGLVSIGPSPGKFTLPHAVTNGGDLVVGTHRFEQPGLYEQAFSWVPATGMAALNGLPNGAENTEANDVNSIGSVIVGATRLGPGSDADFEAFRMTAGGGLQLLGQLPGGGVVSEANAVSADGSVVAGEGISSSGYEAFKWTASTGIVGIGDLCGGSCQSLAQNISADGNAIVGFGVDSTGSNEAFRWKEITGMQSLGTLSQYEAGTFAHATSGDGSIVVGEAQGDNNFNVVGSDEAAFVWDQLHGMRNLQQVLSEGYGLGPELDGWRLLDASDISADGLSITGDGISPEGKQEAWLVRLNHPISTPEPSSLALALLAAAALATPRIFRQRH